MGWLGTLYEFNRQADTPFLTTLGRLNFAVSAFIVLFGFLFVREITDLQHKKHRGWLSPLLIEQTITLAAITLFTPWVDASEHIVNGQHTTVFGSLFPLYLAHMGLYIAGALAVAFLVGRRASKKTRSQLTIIGLGILVTSVIAVVTNLLLPYLFGYFALQEVGALSTLALLSALAYAISMHQLFDVRVIIKRTFVYTMLLGTVFAIYSSFVFLFTQVVQNGAALSGANFFASMIAAVVIGLTLEPLRKWLDARTDGFLFKREYQHQQVIKEVTQKLLDVVALDEALKTLMETMVKVLHLRHAVTFIFQPGDGGKPVIKRVQQIGYTSSTHLFLGENDAAISYFQEQPEILRVKTLAERVERNGKAIEGDDLNGSADTESERQRVHHRAAEKTVLKKLRAMDIALAVPLELNGQLLGLVLLSEKMSGENYSHEDVGLLESMSAQAISAIQKAKLYEGDKMKSEFVSIASHELLTPISAMEGYLSMILDEGMGEVDPQARNYLDKVYSSAHRLAVLVKDLLSVSRIDSGKIKVDAQQLDIEKLIQESVDQLEFKAKEKELELSFEKATTALPHVWADPDRTTEILVNLIGNAIKYTPQGQVTVSAKREEKPSPCVRVSVQDTGLGMSREAQSHLFEKFYRVATPETSGIQGTGLGLYITRSMVEKMGGAISLHSVPGKGSTFSFTLPLFQVDNVGHDNVGHK